MVTGAGATRSSLRRRQSRERRRCCRGNWATCRRDRSAAAPSVRAPSGPDGRRCRNGLEDCRASRTEGGTGPQPAPGGHLQHAGDEVLGLRVGEVARPAHTRRLSVPLLRLSVPLLRLLRYAGGCWIRMPFSNYWHSYSDYRYPYPDCRHPYPDYRYPYSE